MKTSFIPKQIQTCYGLLSLAALMILIVPLNVSAQITFEKTFITDASSQLSNLQLINLDREGDCDITALTAGDQRCDNNNGTYEQDVVVTYTNAPASGSILLKANNQSGWEAFSITGSPQTLTLKDRIPGEGNVDIFVKFSDDNGCTFTANNLFTAPTNCDPCEIFSVIPGDPYDCDLNRDTYSRDLTIDYRTDNPSGIIIVEYENRRLVDFPISPERPQVVSLTRLPANGEWENIKIYIVTSTEVDCEWEGSNLFQNPQNCEFDPSGDCDISELSVGEQRCDVDNGTYEQDVIITYSDAPTTGSIAVKVNNQNDWELFPITESPQTLTLTNLTPGEGDVDIFVKFSDDNGCTFTANNLFTAPTNCDPCEIFSVIPGDPYDCDLNRDTYSRDLTIDYRTDNPSGIIIVEYENRRLVDFPISPERPQVVSLTRLPANGEWEDIKIYIVTSTDVDCEWEGNNLFRNPQNCGDDPSGNGAILFVVKNANNMDSGDAMVKAHLESTGYTVLVQGQNTVQGSDATGNDLVLISNTVSSTTINTKFTNVSVPVVCYESQLLDDLGMTGGNNGIDYGLDSNEQTMDIDNASHTMSAGLNGEPQIYSNDGDVIWGKPNDNAIKVASTQGWYQDQWSIFGYETGSTMVNGIAPARRASLFFKASQVSKLNENGWALFDAVICWATGCENARFAPEENQVPVIEVFPNPFLDILTIEWNHHPQEVQLILRNLLGQEVQTRKVWLENNYQLNSSSLPAGIYILQIIGDNFNQDIKVVKE